jgi:hypothetical protein
MRQGLGLNMTHDISEICEIAARLSEDAATLRHLGFNEAAQFLELAEAEIDNRVYATVRNGNGVTVPVRARRSERGKAKELPTH